MMFAKRGGPMVDFHKGLQGVVADTTAISFVDGESGKLYYRGIEIAELATHSNFEESAFLLLRERLPDRKELDSFNWLMRRMEKTSDKILRMIQEVPESQSPLSVLQMAMAGLACLENPYNITASHDEFENAVRIVAQTPIIIAAHYRHSQGEPIILPRHDLSHVENFLYMIFGQVPSKLSVLCLEQALILQMDHGFNPSTFIARGVASTLNNIFACISAGAGALAGPLHGGASRSVLEMIKDIQSCDCAEKYVETVLASGQKIMGMGHRVYNCTDPRARILKDLIMRLPATESQEKEYSLLCEVESLSRNWFARQNKLVYTNMDFWTGALYHRLNLPEQIYPGLFAIARVVGWCAHILELKQNHSLYRPMAEYSGPLNVPYISMDERV